MDRLNPPEPLSLSGNFGVAWKKWRQRFHIYMVASGLDRLPDEVKTKVLLHSIGTDALDVYNTFPVVDQVSQEDDQEESKFERTISNFDEYFLPRLYVTYERHRFFTRSQLSEETIDQYVTELSWRKLEFVLLVNH